MNFENAFTTAGCNLPNVFLKRIKKSIIYYINVYELYLDAIRYVYVYKEEDF